MDSLGGVTFDDEHPHPNPHPEVVFLLRNLVYEKMLAVNPTIANATTCCQFMP